MPSRALSTVDTSQIAWVEIRDLDGQTSRAEVPVPSCLIGRAAECSVRLDHSMVSRKHAQITRDAAGRYMLRDLGSRNGTFVDGELVNERALAGGERITIGPFTLSMIAPRLSSVVAQPGRLPAVEGTASQMASLRDIEAPRVRASHLTMVSELFDRLLNTPDPAQRQAELCRLMTGDELHAGWAGLMQIRLDSDEDPLVLAQSQAQGARALEPLISRSVLRAVRQRREPVLASNVTQQFDVAVSIPADVMPLGIVACPVEVGEGTMDVLYAAFEPQYATGEWLALASMAARNFQQAQSAWAARKQAEAHAVMERDLARARQVQMRLVPSDPQVPGLDLAIGFAPCRGVGGDYVDVVQLPGGKVFCAVADVCGKGLPAALVASSVRTMVHASLLGKMDLCKLMDNLNLYLRTMVPEENFVTMVAAMLDPSSGSIEYVNAGHPHPLVITASGKSRELADGTNLPLRLETDSAYAATAKLLPGEMLVLYTDGLSEIPVEQTLQLGTDGLARILAEIYSASDAPAREVAAGLTRRLNQLQPSTEAGDDRTFLLVCNRNPPSVETQFAI